MVPEGGNYKDLPAGVGESRKFNEAWTRYHGDKPSRTIDTGHRNHFHYEYNRVPTIRENARLQSFPDDFVFWRKKIEGNIIRDEAAHKSLKSLGWNVLTVWECELKRDHRNNALLLLVSKIKNNV